MSKEGKELVGPYAIGLNIRIKDLKLSICEAYSIGYTGVRDTYVTSIRWNLSVHEFRSSRVFSRNPGLSTRYSLKTKSSLFNNAQAECIRVWIFHLALYSKLTTLRRDFGLYVRPTT